MDSTSPFDIKSPLALLGSDRVFQYVDGDIGLLATDDQGRRDADRGGTCPEKKDAALKCHFDDAVAGLRIGRLGFLIFHDFDADHKPAPTHITHNIILLRPGAEAVQDVITNLAGVLHSFTLENIQGGECGGDAHRISTESGSM